jgi:hypothetical protein
LTSYKEDKKNNQTQYAANILKPLLEKSRRESPVTQYPKLSANFEAFQTTPPQAGNDTLKSLLMKFVSKKQQENSAQQKTPFSNHSQPDLLLMTMMAAKAPTFSARNVSEVSAVSQISKPAFIRHGSMFNAEGSSDGIKPHVVQPKFKK